MPSKLENKIVSPVIPQPGTERKRAPSGQRHLQLSQQNLQVITSKIVVVDNYTQLIRQIYLGTMNWLFSYFQPPQSFHPKNELFQYGNYNKYYGYRNPSDQLDPRLSLLQPQWFEGSCWIWVLIIFWLNVGLFFNKAFS